MKTRFPFIFRRPVALSAIAFLLLSFTSGAWAQKSVTPGKPIEDPAKQQADFRDALDSAKTLAKANDVAAAEQTLSALNKSKSNTAAWHLETAQRLMQTAEQVARDGQSSSVATLANRALDQLDQAEKKAKDARTRATAKSLAGFIQERYLANPTAARASFEAAAQLDPKSAKAKEAAERLKREDDNLKLKIGGGK